MTRYISLQGEGICCYVTVKEHVEETEELMQELRMQVRKSIGPFATPDYVVLTSALPKTRSGKIMRRVLRKIISGEVSFHQQYCLLEDSLTTYHVFSRLTNLVTYRRSPIAPLWSNSLRKFGN